jgi:hypothetical protein
MGKTLTVKTSAQLSKARGLRIHLAFFKGEYDR